MRFEWALESLRTGLKVRRHLWEPDHYLVLQDEAIIEHIGAKHFWTWKATSFEILCEDWEVA